MKRVVAYIDARQHVLPGTNAIMALQDGDDQETVIVFSVRQARELHERHPPEDVLGVNARTFRINLMTSTLPEESDRPPVVVTGPVGKMLWSTVDAATDAGTLGEVETDARGVSVFWLPPRWSRQGYAACVDARGKDTLEVFFSKRQMRKVLDRYSGLTGVAYEANIRALAEQTDLPEESADAPISVDGAVARLFRMAAEPMLAARQVEVVMADSRGPAS